MEVTWVGDRTNSAPIIVIFTWLGFGGPWTHWWEAWVHPTSLNRIESCQFLDKDESEWLGKETWTTGLGTRRSGNGLWQERTAQVWNLCLKLTAGRADEDPGSLFHRLYHAGKSHHLLLLLFSLHHHIRDNARACSACQCVSTIPWGLVLDGDTENHLANHSHGPNWVRCLLL